MKLEYNIKYSYIHFIIIIPLRNEYTLLSFHKSKFQNSIIYWIKSLGIDGHPMDNKKYYVGILFSVIDQSFNRFTHLFCTLLTKQGQFTGDIIVLITVI